MVLEGHMRATYFGQTCSQKMSRTYGVAYVSFLRWSRNRIVLVVEAPSAPGDAGSTICTSPCTERSCSLRCIVVECGPSPAGRFLPHCYHRKQLVANPRRAPEGVSIRFGYLAPKEPG